MLSYADILDRCRHVCHSYLGGDWAAYAAGARMGADLDADSLDRAEIAIMLEEQFAGYVTDNAAWDKAVTINDIAALVACAPGLVG